jgi:hypothetical protein
LNVHRALDGVDDARKLDEQSVACGLNDPAAAFGDLGVDQLTAMHLGAKERAFLVRTHEAAIAHHVSGEDGCQLAFGAFGWHLKTPPT